MATIENGFGLFRRAKAFLSPPARRIAQASDEQTKIDSRIDDLDKRLQKTEERNVQLDNRNTLLEQQNIKLEVYQLQLSERLIQCNNRHIQLEKCLIQFDEHNVQLAERLVQIQQYTIQLEECLAQLEECLAQLEECLAQLEECLAQLEECLAQLEELKLKERLIQLEEFVVLLVNATAITKLVTKIHPTIKDETERSIPTALHQDTTGGIESKSAKPISGSPASAAKTIKTNTSQVQDDKLPATDQPCGRSLSLANRRRPGPSDFDVDMIGWSPIFRSSVSPSKSDIQTDIGLVCAKRYPIIIVDVLPDCMMAVLISTAGGDGLQRKPQSMRDRSIYVVKEGRATRLDPNVGTSLNAQEALVVSRESKYCPDPGAFVDMLDTFKVPYGSKFEKQGKLIPQSALDILRMRFVVVNSRVKATQEQLVEIKKRSG